MVLIFPQLKIIPLENFELHIDTSPRINRKNGQFVKGHKPHNKGIKMSEWMDKTKIPDVLKCLEIPRKEGNKNLPGSNRIPIVGIKDGKLLAFRSAIEAEKILRSRGINIGHTNINNVLREYKQKRKDKFWISKTAGGFRWFYADEPEKYQSLLK